MTLKNHCLTFVFKPSHPKDSRCLLRQLTTTLRGRVGWTPTTHATPPRPPRPLRALWLHYLKVFSYIHGDIYMAGAAQPAGRGLCGLLSAACNSHVYYICRLRVGVFVAVTRRTWRRDKYITSAKLLSKWILGVDLLAFPYEWVAI